MTDITQESTRRTIEISSGTINYYEAGTGHPLILLHGSGPGATGWSNFAKNIGPLSENFHVYAVDMPGWGDSHAVTWETVDHAKTLVELLDAWGIEKAAVMGNSMGGATVLTAALDAPDRFTHVMTMGAGAMGYNVHTAGDGPTEGLKALIRAYQEPSAENMFALVDVMTFGPEHATPELAQARSDATNAHPEHVANFLDMHAHGGPIQRWFNPEDLRKITAPTLLLHGRDDRVVPWESSTHAVMRIPNSRLVLRNQCGHWFMIEHPEEFNQLVTDFVKTA